MQRLYLVCVLSTLLACKQKDIAQSYSSSTRRTSNSSNYEKKPKKCFKVVDGAPAVDDPAVHVLLLIDPSSSTVVSSCTGTFVSDNTLITAGHCVPAAGEKYVLLATNGLELEKTGKPPAKAVAPLKAFFDPSLESNSRGGRDVGPSQSPEIDLAILVFADHTSSDWLPLANTAVTVGTEVKLVGYGSSHAIDPEKDQSSSVKKLMGYNKIAPLDAIKGNMPTEGLLFTFAWGEPGEAAKHGEKTVSGAPGDSGGPLIANGVIVGTVSRGVTSKDVPSLEQQIGTNTLNVFVDVTNRVAKNLLAQAAAAGARINYADPSRQVKPPENKPSPDAKEPATEAPGDCL